MKVIQTQTNIGEDRILRVKLPDDVPIGPIDVLIVIDSARVLTDEQHRAAAEAGFGALKGLGMSTDEFLAERRDEERRHEKALGR